MVECTKQKTQHDDENQYTSKSPPRELPAGARQRGFGCGIRSKTFGGLLRSGVRAFLIGLFRQIGLSCRRGDQALGEQNFYKLLDVHVLLIGEHRKSIASVLQCAQRLYDAVVRPRRHLQTLADLRRAEAVR